MTYTTEDILQFIDDAGEVRVAAALTTLGYVVQKITDTPLPDASYIVIGTVRMLDAHGLPSVGQRIKVETQHTARTVLINGETYHVAATDTTKWFQTDALGVCAVPFVAGARVMVHIENGPARGFIVPDTAFDILGMPSDDVDAYITPRKPYTPLIRSS